jgi:hypothetical protein
LQQRSGFGTWQKSLKLPGREYVGNIMSLPNSCCNVAPPPPPIFCYPFSSPNC